MIGRRVSISGLGVCLPDRVVTNDDLAADLDTSDEWIRKRTGIRSRRVAAEGVAASDLGVVAARAALADAAVSAMDIDLVVTATISPDHLMPATASRIAHEVGALAAGAFDISAGCTGFVYALSAAAGMVAAGVHDRALVVGAETISRILDWEERSTAVLFGDAAGAVVVEVSRDEGEILGFDLGNDGSGFSLLTVPAGGSRLPASHETVDGRLHYLQMNGREVYKFATRVINSSATSLLQRCDHTVDELDLLVPHQANLRIIEAAARRLGIPPEKVCANLERYGNTSCASIPLCLSEAREAGRLRPGALVMLMGFGAGLTWGSCLVRWGGV